MFQDLEYKFQGLVHVFQDLEQKNVRGEKTFLAKEKKIIP